MARAGDPYLVLRGQLVARAGLSSESTESTPKRPQKPQAQPPPGPCPPRPVPGETLPDDLRGTAASPNRQYVVVAEEDKG